MAQAFPSAFVNKEYRSHQTKVLQDQQKARLIETMDLVVLDIEKRKRLHEYDYLQSKYLYYRAYSKNYKATILAHVDRICKYTNDDGSVRIFPRKKDDYMERPEYQKCLNKYEKLNEKKKKWKQRLYELKEQHAAEDHEALLAEEGVPIAGRKSCQYICPCPSDQCNGFIDRSHTCALCDTEICRKCREVIEKDEHDETNHECDPDVIDTIALLKQDSKACPKCATLIFKIEGCDQMFCTHCNTAFSWRTREIIRKTDRIHNPHYFEWLKNNGGDGNGDGDGDGTEVEAPRQPCRQVIHASDFNAVKKRIPSTIMTSIHNIIRGRLHLEDVFEHPIRLIHPTSIDEHYLLLRKMYITNEINEEQWLKALAAYQKKVQRLTDYVHVFDTFNTVMRDMNYKLYEAGEDTRQLKSYLRQIEAFRVYINDAFAKIASFHKKKATICIEPDFSDVVRLSTAGDEKDRVILLTRHIN